MYQFRILQSIYSVAVTYHLPDYTTQKYACKIALCAKREKEKFLFTLEERSDVSLNSERPQKVMDNLMVLLGNCLYPMELYVSASGELLSVTNFEQIREVWLETSKELLKQNRTQEFEKYLEAAKKNLSDERSFLKALSRDSFIQLYFKDYTTNSEELEFVNFPFQNRKTNYYVRKVTGISNAYTLSPAFMETDVQQSEGELMCRKNIDCGEPLKIEADIHLTSTKSDLYQKHILIEADEDEHKVKTNLFF